MSTAVVSWAKHNIHDTYHTNDHNGTIMKNLSKIGMLPVNRLSGPGGMTGPETAGPVNRPITQ